MASLHSPERQQAHALLDQLSEEQLQAVRSLLEVMAGPLDRLLSQAPVMDDDITDNTAHALDRSRASLARGDGISHDDILREFGLKR